MAKPPGLRWTPDVLTAPEELAVLAAWAEVIEPPNCIVELGVFRGGSLKVLGGVAKVPVYGIDLFGREGTPDTYAAGGNWTKWWRKFAGKQFSWREHEEKAREIAGQVGATILVGDTSEVGGQWLGAKVGLLYIDGDHSYEGVKADWEAWRPHLADNATVIFDDYGRDKYPGINKLIDEIGLPVAVAGKIAVLYP